MSGVRKHKGAVVYSAALHVILVAALSLSVHLPSWQRYTSAPAPIQGVMIDQRVIEKRDQIVRDTGQHLITASDVAGVADVLAEELVGIDIPGCYLAAYERATPVDDVATIPGIGAPGQRTVPKGDNSVDIITFGDNARVPNAMVFDSHGNLYV